MALAHGLDTPYLAGRMPGIVRGADPKGTVGLSITGHLQWWAVRSDGRVAWPLWLPWGTESPEHR